VGFRLGGATRGEWSRTSEILYRKACMRGVDEAEMAIFLWGLLSEVLE